MTDEAFWQLIGRAVEQPGDRDERAEWVTEELTRLPVAGVVEFARRLAVVCGAADTWTMWAAARVVADGCSAEGFRSFQLWLLTLGRVVFERAVVDPDSLAEVAQVRALAARPMREWSDQDWPEWESLDFAAHEAHQEVTGEEFGLERLGLAVAASRPGADAWDIADEDEVAVRLPRLSALFADRHATA
ncbi:DUF4240 domain-containing protein [Actinokineospora globicatena]|uniref:DUF4240 domain-containing protein n=1 Tax=Actinokineospora globicatena TaxID=103729 RepID=UPI0020A3BF24|nr:DUF4240 domain-containing protein [Actinokineospora globicatena]MCP2305761.1 Protein of unknown function (DUF4240) [Actinokineospora globicatena]GLW80384.1 hypothetical protein Aglo01_48650 [Actinokineospora globicatena]GLW87213.1 hypothetical protein Aglo02_48520 [Actinokineospora globicatena]